MRQKRSLRQPGAVRANDIRSIGRNQNAGRSLAQRRTWYADDATDDDDKQPGAGDSDDDGESGESDEDRPAPSNVEDLPEWAQKLLKDTRNEAAANRAKVREIEDAQAEAGRKIAEEKGQFKELYEAEKAKGDAERVELEALREGRSARLEQLTTRNEERLSKLAKDSQETARDIIATAGIEDPDKVSALLDKIIPTLGAGTAPPPMDGGSKGDGRKQTGATQVKLNKAGF